MPLLDLTNHSTKIYSVSELNQHSRLLLEKHFGLVKVEGEISNLATPRSGHAYFSLKDSNAQIRCAFFKGYQANSPVKPEDGLKVTVIARVSLFEGRGDYQLIVEKIEESLEGELKRQFELLKTKLEAEGLFDEAHKRPLPLLPKTIGVITSSSGAAVRDILSTLKTRAPFAEVIIYPCSVQGDKAKEQIKEMIELANKRAECDVLILARGGGSLEDLWPFNEPLVAQAIFESKLPIISGVGHETDLTISDFVADFRAETPTAAAVKACLSKKELSTTLKSNHKHLTRQAKHLITWHQKHLKGLIDQLKLPQNLLNQHLLKLDSLSHQLFQNTNALIKAKEHKITKINARLSQQNPLNQLKERKNNLSQLTIALKTSMEQAKTKNKAKLHELIKALNILSPLNTLERGYSLALDPKGTVLTSIKDIEVKEPLTLKLKDGQLDCRVENVHHK